ncbi:MAG: FAD-dependent oxidoreductase [Atribacterota bacterium]|nr:FAD-dependent oxidoreductase [Atribacterota bacterium]
MIKEYDVIVVGAGPAGITAALSAKRQDVSVLLVEENGFLGGLAASGTPLATFHNFIGDKQIVKGVPQMIVDKLIAEGACMGHIKTAGISHVGSVTPIIPEEAKLAFHEMLYEAGIDILLETKMFNAILSENRVTGIYVFGRSGIEQFSGKFFVDCSGDGDLIAASGAEFDVGRAHDNLCQSMTLQFILGNVDVKKGARFFDKNIWHAIRPEDKKASIIHISGDMDKGDIEGTRYKGFWAMSLHPNELMVTVATDIAGKNPLSAKELTEAHLIGRRQIKRVYSILKQNVPGFENSYVSASHSVMGVRESRRLRGLYSVTREDVISGAKFNDVIGVNGYCIDMHDPEGKGISFEFSNNYITNHIPYRSLIPKKIDGLLVAGRCISASHEALAALRVMANCMSTGQAAGTAAALCVRQNILARELDIERLQSTLKEEGAILDD